MSDHFLRVMAGVLVVVGAVPSKLKEVLNSVLDLAVWFWGQRTRHIHESLLVGSRAVESV